MEKGFKKLNLNEETNSSPIRLRSRKIPRDLKPGTVSSGKSGSNNLCSVAGSVNLCSVAVNDNLCNVAVNDNLCSVAGSENLCSVAGSENNKLVITKTSRNNSKIIYDNNEFVIEKQYYEKIYWRCAVKEPVQCKARFHTNLNFEMTKIKNPYHFHQDINPQKIQADLVSVEVKDRAEKSQEKPRTIITDSLLKVPEQHLVECCIEQIRSGAVFLKDPREIKKDDQIKNLNFYVIFFLYYNMRNKGRLSEKVGASSVHRNPERGQLNMPTAFLDGFIYLWCELRTKRNVETEA
ncbi:hypothetical protein BpHYR1_028687 [Brachionus plicatilis]|uniref:FLYWCH-type domain-containing protein n=1 Tax=Brachionus plicatilis TaxID=10195 RepID=A0A3M7PRD7_BRAPC|nr:hypothetical protein BpHYR1_028687 [Brachionus plicatilis]